MGHKLDVAHLCLKEKAEVRPWKKLKNHEKDHEKDHEKSLNFKISIGYEP